MKVAALSFLALLAWPVEATNKKFTIEVVSVSESMTLVGGTAVNSFMAKIILPDGSHALAGCEDVMAVCDLDNGFPERLKRTQKGSETITTGYPKFEAKRNGKWLTIYTATGKREYVITSSW